MTKDERYKALKSYIASGEVKTFTQILNIIPKSVLAKDAGINGSRFSRKIAIPPQMTVRDIIFLAEALDIDELKVYELIRAIIDKDSLRKGKKTAGKGKK